MKAAAVAEAEAEGICAVLVKGNWRRLQIQQQQQQPISSSTIDHVLVLLRRADVSLAYSFFTWTLSLPHHRHSLRSYWNMVHLLTTASHLHTARNLLHTFTPQNRFLSSPSVLSSLVTTTRNGHDHKHRDHIANSQILSWLLVFYSKPNSIQDGIQVFHFMADNGFVPDHHACSALIGSLAKARLTSTAWKLFDEMLSLGVVPNVYLFNAMIHVCFKSGDAERAQKLVDEMETKAVAPDLFTFNTLISLFSKKGMHYEVLAAQETMEKHGISPDIITYNAIIHGFCREGRLREACRLFKEIKAKGAMPNQVTYTTLIDGYCKSNNLNEAVKLKEEMEAKGVAPTVVTYNAIIHKLCEEGKMKAANDLLNDMDVRKIEPDSITCNTLINAYCKRGDMGFAWKLRNKMVESRLAPDEFTYKALIHGFCKVYEFDRAKEALFDMIDAGFIPNYSTFSWLVDGYCSRNNEEAAAEIPGEVMRRGGGLVDKSVYRSVIRRLCRRGMVASAVRLFNDMKRNGTPCNDSLVHSSLSYAYMSSGKVGLGLEILDGMVCEQLLISMKIFNSINASFEGDDGANLRRFWKHTVEKGVVSKNVQKMIQKDGVDDFDILK